jgi:hypothetical protein
MVDNYTKQDDLSYSIIFDVPENKIEVSKFVEGMQDCLVALEEINQSIVSGIDTSIQVVSYIEKLSAGSVDFELKDEVKNKNEKKADKTIEAVGAGVAAACGDFSGAVVLLLKRAKTAIFNIISKKISNNQKKEEIKGEIEKQFKESNINNELKGYYLDEDRLNKAIKHFAKGVKKTGDNVFYQPNKDIAKQKIDSSLAEEEYLNNENIQQENEIEEEKILSESISENDPLILLTLTYKKNCKWKFEDAGEEIFCDIEDDEFINKVNNREIATRSRDVFKVNRKITKILNKKGEIKPKHTILKVLDITEEKNLLNWNNS